MKKIIKNIAKLLGYIQIAQFLQNIFRTRYETDMYLAQLNVVAKTHEKTFGEYKNKYFDKDIAIIATGPSLRKYKPIENTINIGVNKTVFYDKVKFDYFFVIDYKATKPYFEEFNKYSNAQKFYGILPKHPYGLKERDSSTQVIPESLVIKHNANKYYVYQKIPHTPVPFSTEIDKTWLVDGGSCVFSAVQFALFTNPKRIYLVGCDCSSGYFDGKKGADCSYMIDSWKELKKFADIYYPDTEIISVNPVGLKGLFTDLYQDESV